MMHEEVPLVRKKPVSNKKLQLAVFAAVLGNFNFGYSMVYSSPVIPYLESTDNVHLRMDTEAVAWFGSIFTLGAAAGGLASILLNDGIGRKLSVMISAVPSALGYLVMGGAQSVWMLFLGRFLTGVAGGMTSASVPVYVSEISSPAVRGALGSCPQITAVFGSLALYTLGLFLPWRSLAIAGEIPAVLMLVLMCFMPKSPRYLIAKSRTEEARKALQWLRGKESDFITELQRIEQSVASQREISWSDLKQPFYYKPIFISVVMRFLLQTTGITPILVYLEPIFYQTNVTLEPKYDAALVGLVRLLSVVIAASLMDRAGRKPLLYLSGFLMFIATQSMSVYTRTIQCPNQNTTSTPQQLLETQPFNPSTLIPLISTMVIIFGYAIGWGPIAWLLMSEILPFGARGVTSGLCVGISWVTAFVLTHVFIHVVDTYGLFLPFFFFSVMCVINIVFTAVFVPETRTRSLEEIENYFRTGRKFTIVE